MYSGKNPSALRSQQWLADSLVDLMKVKEFQHISVKEICQQADLTRQTFYQIFSSKEDVIRYNIMRGCERFKTSLSLHLLKFTQGQTSILAVVMCAPLLVVGFNHALAL